jgi:RimJ/RimL family protein N-acetyltransferase
VTLTVRTVRDDADLEAIMALQEDNHVARVSPDEARAQGFVTVTHTLDVLRAMHALGPSIVAYAEERLAGYALTMAPAARLLLPILEPMFRVFETLTFRGVPLTASRYYVMGQVCVAKAHRGKGVFDALYRGHREHNGERFDLLVTEVAMRNARSMRAHARVGFEVLHRYRDETDDWAILGWPW